MFHCFFFTLDADKFIAQTSQFCHPCSALKLAPRSFVSKFTCDPPEFIDVTFAADVLKRNRQLTLGVCMSSTSYTAASIVDSEHKHSLFDALICLVISLCPLDGPSSVIRVDSAPGFASLVDDPLLQQQRINIEVGHRKITIKPSSGKGSARIRRLDITSRSFR